MDSIVLYLREDILLEDKSEAKKIRRKRLVSSYSRTKNCTSALFLGHIYSTFTPKRQSYSLRNCMKEFVEATQEANLCLIEPSLGATGGQICRKKYKSM